MTNRAGWFLTTAFLLIPAGMAVSADATDPYAEASQSAVRRIEPFVVQLRLVGGASSIDGVPLGRALTGLLLPAEGWVVTTCFGFDEPPNAVIAVLPNGQQTALEMVAVDHLLKIVLLRSDSTVGPREDWPISPDRPVSVGQTVLAAGRSYRADEVNVSRGVVSAVDRLGVAAIQVDAAVSSANYGGPLVDLDGHLLGLLTPLPAAGSERMSAAWYDSGIGFAVPIERVLDSVRVLRTGRERRLGELPFSIDAPGPFSTEVVVAQVSEAVAPDLRVGDRLLTLNGSPVLNQTHAKGLMAGFCEEDEVALTLERAGERIETRVAAIPKSSDLANKKTPRAGGARGVEK